MPSGRNSEPPAIVLSYNDFPLAVQRRTPSASIQRVRRAVGLDHQHPVAVAEVKRVDPLLGDVADVVQRQAGRVEELQSAVAAVGADESGDEVVGRVGQQPRRRVVLLQHAAAAEHGDLVAELDRLVDVVGDEHDRLAQFALQPQDFGLQLRRGPPGRRR